MTDFENFKLWERLMSPLKVWLMIEDKTPSWHKGEFVIYKDETFADLNGVIYPLFKSDRHVGDYLSLEDAKEAAR